ncbi:GIY-YIG nuclease family protein [Lysobacter korlensis]|uniref:GIY-YIG nuclease family protein n=1 Tax=Lysobacter korlensis TaxID=553636 RepID=A0ABV6RXS7_9GAMM
MDTYVNDVRQAISALSDRGSPPAEAEQSVPSRPGLYAIHADRPVWEQLGLEPRDEKTPLYVGKAERSLTSRDLRTHFRTGRTGSSTVRRSLAALLRERLSLHAVPRNQARPRHFANYGLEAEGDARLTAWMHEHLTIAVWATLDLELGVIETLVIDHWQPPLNLSKVSVPSPILKAARQAMADEARRAGHADERSG